MQEYILKYDRETRDESTFEVLRDLLHIRLGDERWKGGDKDDCEEVRSLSMILGKWVIRKVYLAPAGDEQ